MQGRRCLRRRFHDVALAGQIIVKVRIPYEVLEGVNNA